MQFNKGDQAKKLPRFLQVRSVVVVQGKARITAQPVSMSILASFRRESTPIPPGRWYYFIDQDGWLHLYPHPEKRTRVGVLIDSHPRWV